MRDFIALIFRTLFRIMFVAAVLVAIYNPWASLYQWLYPEGGGDYQDAWLFKVIVVLIALGLLVLLTNTAHNALGLFGVAFFVIVLGLISSLPFYLHWIVIDARNVFYVAYFGALPTLLGFGMSAGFWHRYMDGTVQTTSVDHGGNAGPGTQHHA